MKFSIIIPVYNCEDKLNRCVESIINQDYSDYELILINDGSSDNSGEICLSYAKKYSFIRYIQKENGGASSARNAGIDNAKGDYILFVDSDDYVPDDFFRQMDGREVKDGLAVFTYSWNRASGCTVRQLPEKLKNNDVSDFEKVKLLILSRTINSPYAKIFDANLINKNGISFNEKMPVAEDFNFGLEYLIYCKSVFVYDISVYFYDMTNENSLVNSRKKGLIDIYPIVFDYAFNTIKQYRFSDSEKNELFRIWDNLHTDSFITCVMEELKDDNMSYFEKIKEIRSMCSKFYCKYKPEYGYENSVHFAVRTCIKFKLANTLYLLCCIYAKIRR